MELRYRCMSDSEDLNALRRMNRVPMKDSFDAQKMLKEEGRGGGKEILTYTLYITISVGICVR